MILVVLGPPLAQAVFGHGHTSAASAHYLGVVFGVFCLGLLPYTTYNLLLRAFYALRDSRTPALVGMAAMSVQIIASATALMLLPPAQVDAWLAVGFGVASVVLAVWLWRILSRRVGGLDTRRILGTLVRMHVAAIPGLVFAVGASVLISHLSGGPAAGLATVAVGLCGGVLLYLLVGRKLKITEIGQVMGMLRSRLRR
jgi:putative peptidoglycan lipid II flippase